MSDESQLQWAKLVGFIVGCGAITQAELPELLHAAGFTGVRFADQPMPTRVVILADKPT